MYTYTYRHMDRYIIKYVYICIHICTALLLGDATTRRASAKSSGSRGMGPATAREEKSAEPGEVPEVQPRQRSNVIMWLEYVVDL